MLSGSKVFETESDFVPPPGSTVSFVMQAYKKGIEAGTAVTAVVLHDLPPHYEYGDGETTVMLDVGEFRTHDSDD